MPVYKPQVEFLAYLSSQFEADVRELMPGVAMQLPTCACLSVIPAWLQSFCRR